MNLKSISLAAVALLTSHFLYAALPTDLVNPFVGTTNFGATNPGAVLPNGLMSVSPFNVTGSDINRFDKDARWWSTPYEFYNTFFTGFSHVNLSGVGCPELGSILTMATTGALEPDYRKYGSTYVNETASPGYYSLQLPAYGITAEATATERTSREKFTFRNGGQGNILVNLGQQLSNESGATVRRVSPTEIEGSKLLGTFCYNPGAVFPIYFVARVNKVPSASGYWKMQPEMTGVEAEWTPDNGKYKIYENYGRELSGDDIGYWFTFDSLAPGQSVELSVGVSFTSVENARRNLEAEQSSKATFDGLRAAATDRWNADLGKVKINGGTEEQQKVFYTALYHSLIHPSVLSDVNGEYPLMETIGTGRSRTPRYTVFSLWDTYRNLHQLLTLLYPDRQNAMLNSMVDMYKEWGWLPKWELFGRETFTMEGDPATCVIVDSWLKGLKGFDVDAAFDAMVKSATTPGERNAMRPDIDPYAAKGYVPVGHYAGDLSGDNSVSHALEYYVADAALATMARQRGLNALADSLQRRSLGYRHYYSPEYGTLRPLNADGSFLSPFDPEGGANFSNATGFHEGSAWNYTFAVPHDVEGLIELNGGEQQFTRKLQHMFDAGLYDPANEPDIAYPYLFSRIPGEEWRTQREVARLLRDHYTTAPDGIPGNDDCGTMSAWAVFSMLGFYPDCPGQPFYTLTSPTFDKAEITLPSGSLTITAERETPDAIYIKEVWLDGKKLDSMRVPHSALASKGRHTLRYVLESRQIPSVLDHVDPLIGTGDHGHVFVGANVPFGMVQLGPTSVPQSWDWCSGYHESDSTVIGFSHTHLSGTGIGDLFDVTIRPVTSRPSSLDREKAFDLALRSREVARPGYYSVPLSSGILAEMTATTRTGLSRYTYPSGSDAQALVIDLNNGGCWDKVTESSLQADGTGTLVGHRRSTGWAKDQNVYFAIRFSRGDYKCEQLDDHHFMVTFPGNDEPLMVKVGISPVSVQGAIANLDENPGWNFDKVRSDASRAWENELGKVKVESDSEQDLRTFYTALYHTHFFPATFSDINASRPAYTIYSLWDTYRAEMPLLSILQPRRYPEMINSMLDIFDKQGRLPVWHLWGNETDCMVGNPGIIPVADAVVKGIPGVDVERALKAMTETTADTARGGALRKQYGYIPCDLFPEAIAFDMEYAVADGAIANAARVTGHQDMADDYDQRARSWRNYFDPSTGFVRGKMADGSWRTPFDPNFAQHRANDYCEGNAWQYTWLAPQDIEGLVEGFGSLEATLAALDSLFTAPMIVTGDDASPDISGLIGQYAHGNEPVHHVIYLYSMLGEHDRAADRVKQTLAELYSDRPAGLSGNEDAGQMSAWYVLSSLGFYQPEPASGRYWFGYPKWKRASVATAGGEMLIEKTGDGDHIDFVELNGRRLDRHYITHAELTAGGNLTFHMKK